MRVSVLGGIVVATLSSSVVAGPEWIEQGDAGSNPLNAQSVTTSGSVSKIRGSLDGAPPALFGTSDFEDVYRVVIAQPTTFHLRTDPESGGGADFNTFLWVFSETGLGILGNDDASNPGVGSAVFQFSTDGTNSGILAPGIYLLAVSGTGNLPTSGGLTMFFFASPTEISGPDGPGGAGVLDGWSAAGQDGGAVGDYELALQGVVGVPGPGAMLIVSLGMISMNSRRRRALRMP